MKYLLHLNPNIVKKNCLKVKYNHVKLGERFTHAALTFLVGTISPFFIYGPTFECKRERVRKAAAQDKGEFSIEFTQCMYGLIG